jgi:hypothetical protein
VPHGNIGTSVSSGNRSKPLLLKKNGVLKSRHEPGIGIWSESGNEVVRT